jgi:hypothetical protein
MLSLGWGLFRVMRDIKVSRSQLTKCVLNVPIQKFEMTYPGASQAVSHWILNPQRVSMSSQMCNHKHQNYFFNASNLQPQLSTHFDSHDKGRKSRRNARKNHKTKEKSSDLPLEGGLVGRHDQVGVVELHFTDRSAAARTLNGRENTIHRHDVFFAGACERSAPHRREGNVNAD